jgi:membrane protein implicated in regulation of membrane protease activity
MDELLAPARLVFLIPLAFGLLLGLGAASGLGGDADGTDVDAGHAHDVEAGDHGAGALAALVLGRIPLLLGAMVFALAFGGLGLLVGPWLGAALPGAAGLVLAVGTAAGGATAITRGVARLLATRLRLVESESVRREELAGRIGTAILPVGPDAGLLQVHDGRGNLHQLACRTPSAEPPVPAGRAVLIVEYDRARGLCLVVADPTGRER